MTIDSRKAPVELISLFIILSPLEHVARVEQIGYVFLIGVLLLLFSKNISNAFLYLHYLLYAFYWYRQKATMFYIACLTMSGCFVLTYSSITGLSEWIFIIGLMSTLSYLDHSNMK